MAWLLNLGYLVLLVLAAPWLLWRAIRQGKYRAGYREKLFGLVPERSREDSLPCIWFHAVSVGEVNLLAPLLRRIASERPEWKCLLSTTTATGLALARKKYPEIVSFYGPLDFSWAVWRAMQRIRPTVLVLVELELWPNLIRAARRAGAKVALINGRLSQRSFRGYRWLKPLMRWVLRQVDLFAVQTAEYAERFLALGAPSHRLVITGSMKFDGAQTDRFNPATQRLAQLAGFQPQDIIFLAGSTQAPEEAMALDTFRQFMDQWPQLRLVLVPRHPERFEEVVRLLKESGLPWMRRTDLEKGGSEPYSDLHTRKGIQSVSGSVLPQSAPATSPGKLPGAAAGSSGQADPQPETTQRAQTLDWPGDELVAVRKPSDVPSVCQASSHSEEPTGFKDADLRRRARILLVDTVGELAAWWGTAHIAFVGGSMGRRGGQNMIEPAAYGAAVCFGPNTHNFRDIVSMLLARQAAVVVHSQEELTAFVRRCLEEPTWAAQLGQRAQALVFEQQGATEQTFRLLCTLIPDRYLS
ncbi:MAG: 3-deoxy-D-manno-octulosonic acid transferase [Thermoguttaceae bacterium]|nr:3-deoxy-D-manno-octulosonic acid transferase [Thermoguttaceae bacterium]MDW8037557.1 3-deoxy-D-manno-octulosonic acid transferase [Thermoguttaceae bacterium]